ncbi:MAG: PAS domain-containing protein, partial [Planctomycetota bacterium]|nr:PAS domain-containing protein [Planctomycetota bacterium]
MESSLDPFQFAVHFIETVREPFLVLDDALRVRHANDAFLTHYEVEPADTIGRPLFEIVNGQWRIEGLDQQLLRLRLREVESFEGFTVTHEFENLGVRSLVLNARRVALPAPAIVNGDGDSLILLAFEDVTERQRGEARLARQALESMLLHKATVLAAETSSFEEALES